MGPHDHKISHYFFDGKSDFTEVLSFPDISKVPILDHETPPAIISIVFNRSRLKYWVVTSAGRIFETKVFKRDKLGKHFIIEYRNNHTLNNAYSLHKLFVEDLDVNEDLILH